jgi:hypothetical protein
VRLIAPVFRLTRLLKVAVTGGFTVGAFALSAWAQGNPVAAPLIPAPVMVAKPAPVASTGRNSTTIEWRTLSAPQQVALQPLQSNWNSLSDLQKRKWLSVSANYPRMSPEEQAKLHSRMAQWAALSPRQREHARLNYAEVQKISPQQKNEKWEAYQALNPTDKQKLVASAQPKPPRTALAIQPTPPDKINQLPLTESTNHVRLPVPMTGVASKTLLVKPVQPSRPASTPANASSNN